MSFLSKLFGGKERSHEPTPEPQPFPFPTQPQWMTNPLDPKAYPENIAPVLSEIQAKVDTLIKAECTTIAALGLPLPEQLKPLTFVTHYKPTGAPLQFGYVEIQWPKYNGSYTSFKLRQTKTCRFYHTKWLEIDDATEEAERHLDYQQAIKFSEKYLDLYTTYSLLVDEALGKQASEDCKTKDLAYVVANYPGVWCNRPPGGLFLFFDFYPPRLIHGGDLFSAIGKDVYFEKYRSVKRSPTKFACIQHMYDELTGVTLPIFDQIKELALSPIPPLSAEEVAARENRFTLFCSLLDPYIQKPNPEYKYSLYPIPDDVTDHALTSVPLPPDALPTDRITLKVLPTLEYKASTAEQFFESLRYASAPISFELVATLDRTYFQFSCAQRDRSFIEHQLELHFPDFALEQAEPPTQPEPFFELHVKPAVPYEYINSLSSMSLDPYTQLFGIINTLGPGQQFSFQIDFFPLSLEPIEKYLGPVVLKELQQRCKALEKKLPAFAVSIKCTSTSKAILQTLSTNFLGQYHTLTQRFDLLPIEERTEQSFDFTQWSVLSAAELTSLAHFPSREVRVDNLETTNMKAKLPPPLYTTAGSVIGTSEARGQTATVTIPDSVRDRHLYIVGKTRMGKSTLLTNLALADIENGSGVCVIDPHGDLVEDLLNLIPEKRINDTIYFHANDKEHPIALNVLQAQNEDEVALLADNLHVTFRRLSESWGQRMDDILRATLQTLALIPGATFVDIKRLLQDKTYRDRVTQNLDHPMLKDFWQMDFPAYPKDATQPIISRVNRFLYAPHFYKMFSSSQSSLTLSNVIAEQKILLVNLASGAIGDDNAQLLGSLLVSQIQQAVMRRAALPREARIPYYLFIDEFQNFTNSAFDKILSEAGKYKLCLTLAHQFISQLADTQRDAIFGNVGTMIMFGVGDKDAMSLRNQLGSFEPTDLLNLPRFQALCRPTTAARDTFSFQTSPPPPQRESHAAAIIEHTRERYSTKVILGDEPTTEAPVPAPLLPVQPIAPTSVALPVKAAPKTATIKEQIMGYLSQVNYLSTRQIIDLCFESHTTEGSKKKELQLRFQIWSRAAKSKKSFSRAEKFILWEKNQTHAPMI